MMFSTSRFVLVTCVLLLATPIPLLAQSQAPEPDMAIDAATRAAVIDGALRELQDYYVFPEVAAKMAQGIRGRQRHNEYDSITSAQKLAETLTADLREASRDQHIRVVYSAAVWSSTNDTPVDIERQRKEKQERLSVLKETNYGFDKIELLGGFRANIGYLNIRGFFEPELMGDTAAAAMNFLANVDALIIDLRSNGGGDPEGAALLASYLFGSEAVRLNDIYDRRTNETRQYWTLSYVPGKRLADRDVYILTSARTFSAAEDFVYALKALKRITIVGETTRGGAHPSGSRRINDHFYIQVPWARSINYITKADWEGVGVEPDAKVPAAQALPTALLMALEKRLSRVTDPNLSESLIKSIDGVKKELCR